MEIHEKIKQLRESKRISGAEMSSHLNMTPQNYWNIESGKVEMTVSRLRQIAEILGVSVVELITGEPQKVEDSGRVAELEKRIEELEDRIKDKDFIIQKLSSELKVLEENLGAFFYHDVYLQAAIKYNIGRIELYEVESDKIIISFGSADKDSNDSPIWKEAEKDGFSKIDYRYSFTEKEKVAVAKILFSDTEFGNIAISFVYWRFIDSEFFKYVYQAYEEFRKRIKG